MSCTWWWRPSSWATPGRRGSATSYSCATRSRSVSARTESGLKESTMQLPTATIRTQIMLPLRFADGFGTIARVYSFDGLADGREHLALGLGGRAAAVSVDPGAPLLVRVHSGCFTGDVLGSERCDCGPQLLEAVRRIEKVGGFLLYLRQEGRGIGLYAKLDAYALQDVGLDTYEANRALGHADDERDYTAAAQMLTALGATTVDLLTNNPDKTAQLREHRIDVRRTLPTKVHASGANVRYLQAKVAHTKHTIDLPLAV